MAITPGGRVGDASPLGKGKRRVLDDYVREVAHALMRKGFSKGHAIATAKNSLKRWSSGGGKVRPQVRAGAAAHLGAQKALDAGGRRDLAGSIGAVPPIDLAAVTAPAVSSQDGPRVRLMAEMAKRKKPKMAAGRKVSLTAAERAAIIDLVGPKGYSHGWVRADAKDLKPGANVRHTRNGDAYHSGTVISNHADHAVIATKHKSGEYTGKTMKVKHDNIHGPSGAHGSNVPPADALARAHAALGKRNATAEVAKRAQPSSVASDAELRASGTKAAKAELDRRQRVRDSGTIGGRSVLASHGNHGGRSTEAPAAARLRAAQKAHKALGG